MCICIKDDDLDFGIFNNNNNLNADMNLNEGRINVDLAAGRAVQRNVIRNYFT